MSASVGTVFPFVKLKVSVFKNSCIIYLYNAFIIFSEKFVHLKTGEKVGSNEMGEIAAKTPFLMKEYLNNPEVMRI